MSVVIRFSSETIKNPENWVSTARGEIPYWNPSWETVKKEMDKRGYNIHLLNTEETPSGSYFIAPADFEKDLTADEKMTIINNCPIDEDYDDIF